MKIKKLLIAFLAGAMLFAMLPLNVLADYDPFALTVQLSFARTSSTSGTLTIIPTSTVQGYFVYSGSSSGYSNPTTTVNITPPESKNIELTGLPSSSYYYITYYTLSVYGKTTDIQTYIIDPNSTGTGTAVSIISSSRTGNDVSVSLNVNEPCVFYYSSDMQNWSGFALLSTGLVPSVNLMGITSNTVYYYTESVSSGVKSSIRSFTVGGSTSNPIYNYPNLTSYSLTQNYDGRIIFSYTADRSGYIYFVISSTSVSSINTSSAYPIAISAGSSYFEIPVYLFTQAGSNAKMYFVTADNSGNKSSVRSVSLGSSSTSGYPTLTNCSVVLTSANTATFYYTSDKPGAIAYIVSTTSPGSTNFMPTGYAQLSSGSSSFTITSNNLTAAGAKVYYYTVDSTGYNFSSLQSVSIGTSGVNTYPTLTNVYYTVSPYTPNAGTLTFTSNMSGYICYTVSTDTSVSKNTTSFVSYPITQGINTINITSYTIPLTYAPLYFYTMINPTTYDSSSLSYIQPNTSTVYPVNDATSTISSVEIKNVVEPAVGANPSTTYTNSDNRFNVSSVEWQNATLSNTKLRNNDIFQPGYKYSVVLTLDAKTGYTFPANYSQFSAKINGKTATLDRYTTNSVTIKYTFDTLTAAEIKSVGVNNITDPVAGQFPDTDCTPADSSYYISRINWDTTTLFKSGDQYKLQITLVPANGYTFNVENAKIGYRNAKIETKSSDSVVISYNYWVNPFTDVREYDIEPTPSNPNGVPNRYYVFIKYCYLNELFVGNPDNTFTPDNTMTRAMFVTVLGRLAGVDVTSFKSNKFKDVDSTAYYAPYVAWATQNNIVVGKTETSFAPEDPVTREQMCVLLQRYAKYAGISLKYTQRAIGFTDASNISDYAKEAVSIFEQAGVALSRPNTTGFNPKDNALRKEIAEMLILFMIKYMNN